MFQVNSTATQWEDNDYGYEQKEIIWSQTPIFFRFGFYNYFKINANKDYFVRRQESDKWYRIDLILDW